MSETHAEIPPLLPLGHSVWAIREDVLPRLIDAHRNPHTIDLAQAVGRVTGPQAATRRLSSNKGVNGAVAVIPLTGVITPHGSFLSLLFGGGGGLQAFRDSFREAVASPDVGAIVLDVDSPGGLVSLVPETAAEIRAARGSKPIVAVANTLAASAAYWIAAQADELVVTPSGEAGSIGVYMVHEDWSKFNADFGVVPTYIKAGRFKTEGNPDEPLSDEAEAAWQQEVDDLYGMFVQSVAEGRGVSADVVRRGYGEGRSLLAGRALEAGLVDRIDTLETVTAELLGQEEAGNGSSASSKLATQIADAITGTVGFKFAAEQPRCKCGKWLEAGETECEACQAIASEDEDKPAAEESDEGEKPAEDVDDEDADGEPVAPDAAEQRRRRAELLFG